MQCLPEVSTDAETSFTEPDRPDVNYFPDPNEHVRPQKKLRRIQLPNIAQVSLL